MNDTVNETMMGRFHPSFTGQCYIGPGWIPLVEALDEKLVVQNPDYVIFQIKEKFGGLRFYTDFGPGTEGFRLVCELEDKCWHICEECGLEGKMPEPPYRGWVRTLCDSCRTVFDRQQILRVSDV